MASESTAGNPFRELIKHTFVYGSGYVTMALASFILVPLYTHRLSPADYGLLGLMLVLYGLMSQIYDFGVTNSVGRFYFDAKESERDTALLQLRTTAIAFVVVFGGALTVLLWLLAGTWSRLLTQTSSHADLVRLVAITLYAEGLSIVPLTMIRMQERSRLFVAITIARFVVTLGLGFLFVLGLGLGVRGALMANAASAVAVVIVLLPDYRNAFKARPSWTLLRQMLGFGLPFFPVILSAWFIEASDRYLLNLYKGQAAVGLYVLGYKVAQVLQIAVAAFSMGWAPLRYKIYGRADAADTYRRITNAYVIVAGLLTVGVSVFARQAVALISPASYKAAASIVPLIAFGYALNGLYLLMVTGMGIAKRTGAMAGVVTVAAIANVGINVLWMPVWGMHAAAVTTVMANVVMVVGGWYYSQKVYAIPYDWSKIFRTIMCGSAVVAAVAFFTPGHGWRGIASGIVALLVFGLLLVSTGVISRTDVSLARRRLTTIRGGRGAARERVV